jgi:hypothetical protein
MAKRSYYKRAFLNLPDCHSVAFVYAKLDGEHPKWPDLMIGDCSRSISLDVSLNTEDCDNTLHKLDVLTRTLKEFRAACYDAVDRIPPRL